MLSEIMFSAYETREPQFDRIPGLSISGLYPCAYRMYKTHIGEAFSENVSSQNILNMEDGWDQEDQAVRRLKKAGIEVLSRGAGGRRVSIGRSNIPGSFDGKIDLKGETYLWEFKAMNQDRFSQFVRWGLKTFPNYRAQYNGYLLGASLSKCIFQSKCKDNNNYHDIVVPLEMDFIIPIVEKADRIRTGWMPEPEECKWCLHCGFNCFGMKLDFSWIKSADSAVMADKWKKGKIMRDAGELAMEEAKKYFVGVRDKEGRILVEGLIGTGEVLLVEDLKIQKVVQHRHNISKESILRELGPEGLAKVMEFKETEFYTIREVS